MCLFGFCSAVIISLSSLHVCYIHALLLMLSKLLYFSQKGYLLFSLQHVSFHFKFLTLHTLCFWFFVNEYVYLMVRIYLLTLSSTFIFIFYTFYTFIYYTFIYILYTFLFSLSVRYISFCLTSTLTWKVIKRELLFKFRKIYFLLFSKI